jgi:16S rRNA G527 N7-methylase RsmG
VQIVEQSASKSASDLALNRALGELKDILDGAENIPRSERQLIINTAQTWQNSLLAITG